jgi:hypothetical protein
MRAGMLPEHLALAVDDPTGSSADPVGEEPAGIAVGDEADVVAVRLIRNGEPAQLGLAPYVCLERFPEREHRVRDLVGRQHPEDVRLVLARVDGTEQRAVP